MGLLGKEGQQSYGIHQEEHHQQGEKDDSSSLVWQDIWSTGSSAELPGMRQMNTTASRTGDQTETYGGSRGLAVRAGAVEPQEGEELVRDSVVSATT